MLFSSPRHREKWHVKAKCVYLRIHQKTPIFFCRLSLTWRLHVPSFTLMNMMLNVTETNISAFSLTCASNTESLCCFLIDASTYRFSFRIISSGGDFNFIVNHSRIGLIFTAHALYSAVPEIGSYSSNVNLFVGTSSQ